MRAAARRGRGAIGAASRLAGVLLFLIASLNDTGGVAFAVVGGKTVSISMAPWNVVVWEAGQMRCTGVIIDPRHVLTAEHCMMYGESATPVPAFEFTIEAGVSNFEHPLRTDREQTSAVSAVRLMPGYIAASKTTRRNQVDSAGHDLAVLTLARPLDLNGDDARAAELPNPNTLEPWYAKRLVTAGFGEEKDGANPNGTLNEITTSAVFKFCSTSRVICFLSSTATCWGDSGSGLIERGPHPTVVGILSEDALVCSPDVNRYMSLTSPAVLRFIKTGS